MYTPGGSEKKHIEFSWTMETTDDSIDHGGVQDEVKDVEDAIANFLGGFLACKESRRLLDGQDRRLDVIGVDPGQADVISKFMNRMPSF